MQKLSLLTFTRNHVERLFGMIEDLYDTVDDIVIIDSSDKKDREELNAMIKKKKWNKIRIYYIVPLGFMELYRPYGLKKCKNEWVLFLCVDERISVQLKSDVIDIINNTKCAAFNADRYENVSEGESKSNFFTFQIQLFRKSMVKYKGIVDERPEVNGETCMLDSSKYYVRHIFELMRHQFNEYYMSGKFAKYECMSYADFNDKILANYARAIGKSTEDTSKRMSWKLAITLLHLYEKAGFKKPELEISPFDYFVYTSMRGIGYGIKEKSITDTIMALPRSFKIIKIRQKLKSERDHDEAFRISRIITTEGIIKFLNLNDEKELKRLNKKYMDNKDGLAGIFLLMHLLKERYNSLQESAKQN
jgi:hypothetical protein